jgi:hypothetical protein
LSQLGRRSHSFIVTCWRKRNWSSGGAPQVAGAQKEKLVNKNQGWEPIHQKYKVNENISRHNPKKKQKQTIDQNQVKALCKEGS